jgi:hypothetical protein
MALSEDISNQPVAASLPEAVGTPGDDARGILAAVLHDGQRIIERLVDRRLADDSYDSAHG